MASSVFDTFLGGVKRVGPYNSSEVMPVILICSSNRTMRKRVKTRTQSRHTAHHERGSLHSQVSSTRTS
ncbi:hypothetical protein E4T39_07943 [Aureobasidium subglaciale]|nr:hypothetical protein E4T39_07943 [Aureobasidium subglaciale]